MELAIFGRFELQLRHPDAKYGSQPGRCDDAIADLLEEPYIAEQLARLAAKDVRAELSKYGAWDAEQLADHDANLARLLWIACGDIREELNAAD